MRLKFICSLVLFLVWPFTSIAQEHGFTLNAPEALVETQVLKHLLPRFSLKTSIRVKRVDAANLADVVLSANGDGTPVFEGIGQVWTLSLRAKDNAKAVKFVDWLTSDIGLRTVESFAPNGDPMFARITATAVVEDVAEFDGDALLGERLSLERCGRCHVVSDANRMNAIGSTPSFALLRNFDDWDYRFSAFYLLNPHPAFTQIEDVTEPFAPSRPSPIVPITLTLEELDAIMAFVATIEPADLGAPIQSQ